MSDRSGGDDGPVDADALDLPPGSVAAIELGLAHEVRTIDTPVSSAAEAADAIGVPAERLAKTLVVRRGDDDFVLVLVPGPASLDWPKLRTHLGVSRLSLPDAEVALEATGYERGTITPLGSRHPWPVLVDAALAGGGPVALGSGRRGASIVVDAAALVAALSAEVTDLTGS